MGRHIMPQTCTEKHLLWPEGFVNEIEKCHGCAKCTTVTAATRMCPVYKITRDESATPRAKANILRLLISGAIDNSQLYHEVFSRSHFPVHLLRKLFSRMPVRCQYSQDGHGGPGSSHFTIWRLLS